jgi:hypothetical protein
MRHRHQKTELSIQDAEKRELAKKFAKRFARKDESPDRESAARVVLTKAAKERLLRNTQELFGDDGWMIGDLNLTPKKEIEK